MTGDTSTGTGGALQFAEADGGLGTAYERVAIYRLFDRWLEGRDVATALEGPVDGMAGMPGLHLAGRARKGTRVTVSLPDQAALDRVWRVYDHLGVGGQLRTVKARSDALPRGTFDLVVSYNALPFVDDWKGYLQGLAGLSSRWLIVVVLNPWSWGIGIRKARELFEGKGRDDHDHPSTRPGILEPELRRLGTIEAHDYLDCPWWPDVLDLKQFVVGSVRRLPVAGHALASRLAGNGPDPWRHTPDHYPLLPGVAGYDELARRLACHPVFDGRGPLLGHVFGHLHGYLVRR